MLILDYQLLQPSEAEKDTPTRLKKPYRCRSTIMLIHHHLKSVSPFFSSYYYWLCSSSKLLRSNICMVVAPVVSAGFFYKTVKVVNWKKLVLCPLKMCIPVANLGILLAPVSFDNGEKLEWLWVFQDLWCRDKRMKAAFF